MMIWLVGERGIESFDRWVWGCVWMWVYWGDLWYAQRKTCTLFSRHRRWNTLHYSSSQQHSYITRPTRKKKGPFQHAETQDADL